MSRVIKCSIIFLTEGDVFNNKIYDFFHSRLGRLEAWDILGLGCFGVGTFWGLRHFKA
jgi:hypothetical protein